MDTFISEIRDFLSASGRNFEEECTDGIAVFRECGRSFGVIALPVAELSAEEAEMKSLAARRLAAAMPDAAVVAEDRWMCGGMVQARLKARIGLCARVYARNCEVRRIDKLTASAFLSENHSYGDAACKYRYGLFTRRTTGKGEKALAPGTLVAVAEFSNARRWHVDGRDVMAYEWVRYASKSWMRVNGGMGKLLQAFIDEVHPDDIMSYADLEWSDGDAYRKLGFVADGDREPVLFTVDPLTYERTAVGKRGSTVIPDGSLFFMNLGSRKYRLKPYSGF